MYSTHTLIVNQYDDISVDKLIDTVYGTDISLDIEIDLLKSGALEEFTSHLKILPINLPHTDVCKRIILVSNLERCEKLLQKKIKSLMDEDSRREFQRTIGFKVSRLNGIENSILSRCAVINLHRNISSKDLTKIPDITKPPPMILDSIKSILSSKEVEIEKIQGISSKIIRFHIPISWIFKWTVYDICETLSCMGKDSVCSKIVEVSAECDHHSCIGGRLKLQYLCLERFFLLVQQIIKDNDASLCIYRTRTTSVL